MKRVLILLFCLASLNIKAQELRPENNVQLLKLDSFYKNFNGSFVLYNLKTGEYSRYSDSICAIQYSPCSTFKIANSLIGLENIAENENYLIKYDSVKNPSEPWMYNAEPFKYWMQDHTMRTAFKYSVVWYYQELARRVGENNMSQLLEKIDYGNNDISSGIDNFWLCGSLKISANEQVEFLKKLYLNQLSGFSVKSQEIVKNIMIYETTDNYILYGKTGGGNCWNDKVIGWYVGFVETKSGTYILP